MAEARIFAELQETKAELQRLKERGFSGTPTADKDLYLVTLFPKWSGSESGISLEEFFSTIEGAAQVGLGEIRTVLSLQRFVLRKVRRNFVTVQSFTRRRRTGKRLRKFLEKDTMILLQISVIS
jgi:hypothetical protein